MILGFTGSRGGMTGQERQALKDLLRQHYLRFDHSRGAHDPRV